MKQRAYLNKIAISGLMAFELGLMTPQITPAQGTITYLSNLGQPSDGTNPVGSDSWLAADFKTGTNVAGYLLDSVQLAMTDASGNPSGFRVMVYSNMVPPIAILPGSSLGTLNGSLSPMTGGIYTYTAASGLVLSPRTHYFIVLTAGAPVADGAYGWSYVNTSSYGPVDGWVGSVTYRSSDGSSWTRLGASPLYDFCEFAINAMGVPEPGLLGFFVLGGLGFFWHRRRARIV
jgi:hypothetical protein